MEKKQTKKEEAYILCHSIHLYKSSKNVNNLFVKDFIYFWERREGREKERERNINVWEKHQLVAFHMLLTGDLAWNPGMCPIVNWTGDLLVPRPMLNPLSHTSQDKNANNFIVTESQSVLNKVQEETNYKGAQVNF